MKIEAIIWDWNGTLLNDIHVSIHAINILLDQRGLQPLTLEQYLEVFTFPVSEYYKKIGFDFSLEPFEKPAHQFIDIYNRAVKDCSLHPEVYPYLTNLAEAGLKQYILSAMKQEQLDETVSQNCISHFFEKVYGLDDHYAASKMENGNRLMKEQSLESKKTLLIGDTIHDYEVATELNCHCILVANGHQSRKRLEATGIKVVNDLSEIKLW